MSTREQGIIAFWSSAEWWYMYINIMYDSVCSDITSNSLGLLSVLTAQHLQEACFLKDKTVGAWSLPFFIIQNAVSYFPIT